MKVIAAKGTRCPKEGNPREYITDDNTVDVPDTAYYKRLVKDGSLIIIEDRSDLSEVKEKGGKK